jgi:hypothetical protein
MVALFPHQKREYELPNALSAENTLYYQMPYITNMPSFNKRVKPENQ